MEEIKICECVNWARIDVLRKTNHHPNCANFKDKKFACVSLDGRGYVMPIDDLSSFIEDLKTAEPEDIWEVRVVKMTWEEYEKLKDFEGY